MINTKPEPTTITPSREADTRREREIQSLLKDGVSEECPSFATRIECGI